MATLNVHGTDDMLASRQDIHDVFIRIRRVGKIDMFAIQTAEKKRTFLKIAV